LIGVKASPPCSRKPADPHAAPGGTTLAYHRDMRRFTIFTLTLAVTACAPMAGAIPVGTMQGSGITAPGHATTAVGAGVGVGGIGWPEGAAGGALQHRVRVGELSELSLGGQLVLHSCDGCAEQRRGGHLSGLGRVGFKWQGSPSGSLLGGVSYGGFPGGTALGVDGGGVFDLGRWCYGSLRFGYAVPVSREDGDFDPEDMEQLGPTTWGAGAFGVHGRGLLLEAGLGLMANQYVDDQEGLAAYLLFGAEL
jgi:hypothetical protein